MRKGSKEQIPEDLLDFNLCNVNVDYRLSPETQALEYVHDASATLAWLFNNIESYGGDSNKIFIAGNSAGRYLTSIIELDTHWLENYGIDINKVAGLISLFLTKYDYIFA